MEEPPAPHLLRQGKLKGAGEWCWHYRKMRLLFFTAGCLSNERWREHTWYGFLKVALPLSLYTCLLAVKQMSAAV